jgi:hypothetical protein
VTHATTRDHLDAPRRTTHGNHRMLLTLAFTVRADHVTAVAVRRDRRPGRASAAFESVLFARALAPRPGDGTWPDLAAAFAEAHASAAARFPVVSPDICVALVPPLARAKAAALVLGAGVGEAVALTDAVARRLFLVPTSGAATGGAVVMRAPSAAARRRGAPADALVARADEEVVSAVAHAAGTACCGVARITAAGAVLGSALTAVDVVPDLPPLAAVAVCGAGWTGVTLSMHGRPVVVLELGDSASDETARIVARCLGAPPETAVEAAEAHGAGPGAPDASSTAASAWSVFGIGAGAGDLARVLTGVLSGSGASAAPPCSVFEDVDADAMVAAGAALALEVPPLLPPSLWAERAARLRRRGRLLWAQAAAVAALAAGVHLWGLDRERAAVQAARAAERPGAAAAIAFRARQEEASEQLEAIARIAGSSAGWAEAIGTLASSLPDTAYVTMLSGDGRVLRVSGRALAARTVVPALAATPLFRNAALLSPVRPVADDGGAGIEEFEVALTLAPSSTATTSRTRTSEGAP